MNKVNSSVEQKALALSHEKLSYSPSEKVGVIVVENFPMLGKLTAHQIPGMGSAESRWCRFSSDRKNAGTFHKMGDIFPAKLDKSPGSKRT